MGEALTPRHDRTATAMRLSGRVIGVLAAAMWLMIFVVGSLQEDAEPFTAESAVLVALGVCAAVGVAVAFRYELVGGVITFVVGCAFTVFALVTAGRNPLIAVMFSGGPFILAGLLFVGSHLRRRPSTE